MTTIQEAITKVDANETKIEKIIRNKDNIALAYLTFYPIVILGDKGHYPLMDRLATEMRKHKLCPKLLRDIPTSALTDHEKMVCITDLKQGTIFMLDGSGPGTVTESSLIRETDLRYHTVLFFAGPDYPKHAFEHTEYTAYYPRKYYYRDEAKLFHLAISMAKQDAYAEGSIQARQVTQKAEKPD